MIDRKDIFMSGFKSKIGYSFTYKDLNEFETIIDFYEQRVKKQKEVIDRAIEYIKERFYFNEETGEYSLLHTFNKCNVKELLDILNEVSE